jgi:hypothetical protein
MTVNCVMKLRLRTNFILSGNVIFIDTNIRYFSILLYHDDVCMIHAFVNFALFAVHEKQTHAQNFRKLRKLSQL